MPPKRRKKADLGKVFPSGVRIDKTSYGFGVFAFAFIEKGTPIAKVAGTVIQDADYSSDYCIDLGEDKVLEPDPPFCYLNHACVPNCQLMHYVREADTDEELETGELSEEDMDFECECGCHLVDDDAVYSDEEASGSTEHGETDDGESGFEDDSDAEIWVETLRDIMPNEELTIDYCWPADRAAKCLCGLPECRGWIVDPAERKLLPD
ncbi:MAG: SET domain-containing protein-lysine N-methyltransferase [Planctomycetaceae bacterium]|nr:SET domain-containing protein-lysine N-methyltransferase [Planctomycetaceae bacterium]